MKKIKSKLVSLVALSALAVSCSDINTALNGGTTGQKKSNRVTNSKETNTVVEDNGIKLNVLSETHLKKLGGLSKSMQSGAEESLLVGFPKGLIGEQNIFGGVITKVSDQEDESLGTLKLTDLSPIHVRTEYVALAENGGMTQGFLVLFGCAFDCSEDSKQVPLITIPALEHPSFPGVVILNLAAVGEELNLVQMLDPKGQYTQLKTKSSDTVEVDFDMKTLLFDVKTQMIPLNADANDPSVKTTDFTVRWYLKLGSGFDPNFQPREATEGVGFFTTERSKRSKIQRFSYTDDGSETAPVRYIIKNVPAEFKPVFGKAIEDWNVEFRKVIGKDLLSYEFVDGAEAEQYIPGDIRYNIIEWDLVNKAGYGGLGPSIANQMTGQIMSANVLVQGPTIVQLYTEWFGVSQKYRDLVADGRDAEANKMVKEFNTKVEKEMKARTQHTFQLTLGKHLKMNVHAQKNQLHDPVVKGHFELVPAGMTYEKYMEGYMLEIVGHELGHNLGLRHNFKGNLGAYENVQEAGTVSRSIMEYLGRPFRHLNTIGSYDRMAISYGYKGTAPKHLNWFCTDEDQGYDALTLAVKSPECSKSDATSDPFSYWESRINRVLDLVLERKSNSAPVWKVSEVESQLEEAITGLSAYALSAENTGDTWTNFFGKNDRPENKSDVKAYVLERLQKRLCNADLLEVIKNKESAEAQKLAQDNLNELKKKVAAKTTSLGLYTAQDIGCIE